MERDLGKYFEEMVNSEFGRPDIHPYKDPKFPCENCKFFELKGLTVRHCKIDKNPHRARRLDYCAFHESTDLIEQGGLYPDSEED